MATKKTSRKADSASFRPDVLETVRLALELLRRIPRNRKITAAELQQQLADAGQVRGIRTIQRLLVVLPEIFDIERELTRPIGYRWKEHAAALTVAEMGEHESLFLLLAEQQMRMLLPPVLMTAMQGFFDQARRNLDPFGDERLATQWLSKVRVISETYRLLPPLIDEGIFRTVSQALYANRMVKIRYRNLGERESEAMAMPYGLALEGSVLWLVCRYPGEEKIRTLALHRMLSASETTFGFERPADFDLERFDADERFAYGDGSCLHVTFRIVRPASLDLRETALSEDQTVRVEDNAMYVRATVVDSMRWRRWLRSYSDEISEVCMEPVAKGSGAAVRKRVAGKRGAGASPKGTIGERSPPTRG